MEMRQRPFILTTWTLRRLGEHAKFLNHGAHTRAELSEACIVKNVHYGDVHACPTVRLNPNNLLGLPSWKAQRLDRLQDGDVVLADASEDITGVSKLVEICGLGETQAVSGQHTIAVRFDKAILADGFKGYLQHHPSFCSHLRRHAAGTKVYAITRAHVASAEIAVPPLAEQQAIAAALSDVDGLIASLDRLIAKKRAIKQAAMQQLLTGKTRLPGFSGEWVPTSLRNLGRTYGGLTGKAGEDFGHGEAQYIPFLNIMNNVVLDSTYLETVNVAPTERQNEVMQGDLFFNGSSETPEEVGMCAVLLEPLKRVFVNSFCFGFRLFHGAAVDGLYLAYYLRSAEGRRLMYSLAQGATRHNLSKTALLALTFPLPALDEQRAISTVLSEMDAAIEAAARRRDKAKDIKQGMMQALLTGRVRLPVKAAAGGTV
jgi:type I restriction enzyme S subunit